MIYYKIRKKSDPTMFRLAGSEPKWNKSGKVYDTLGKLRSAITNCMSADKSLRRFGLKPMNDFSDWEIIEYEVVEKDIKSVHEVVKPEKIMELLKQ